jgi:hypothetical protein
MHGVCIWESQIALAYHTIKIAVLIFSPRKWRSQNGWLYLCFLPGLSNVIYWPIGSHTRACAKVSSLSLPELMISYRKSDHTKNVHDA